MRKKFNISNPANIQELLLDIDYDDAFVAYLNGVEVARANISGNPPAYNAKANSSVEAAIFQGGKPRRFSISQPSDLLKAGENVLSIQAHNISSNSSDFTLIPFLSAYYAGPTTEGNPPPEILALQERNLHTNFKISSAGETLYLYDAAGNPVDQLQVENLQHDVSFGLPPGGSVFVFYDEPTPGLPNGETGNIGVKEANIEFSHPGGPTSSLSLRMGGVSSPDIIRYTLDASIPDENSPAYTEPISISSNTVVRARVFSPGYIPSNSQSRTYLIDASHDLPVISLVTEPENFFDSDHGIYVYGDTYEAQFPYFGANFWEDWERPIHFTLYEKDDSRMLAFNGGTKIFGGWSRGHEQRSLSIFARKQYGVGEINYPLFPDQPYETYQSLVLRNSGNDWLNTMLRDAALTGLMKDSGLDYQAYRPAVTYINGEYWGFYNMREKVSEHFLASKHDLDPDEVDLLERNGQIIHGDNQDYQDLINFVDQNNLADEQNYQYVKERIDIENFIIYQVAQIYFDNTDWPGNNVKFWRPKDGKWRWILFDTDFGFGIWNTSNYGNNTLEFALEDSGPGWPNPPWSTLLFRKLAENIEFRNAFVNRFADELNSRFLPNRVGEHIDSLSAVIAPEIERHYSRWERGAQNWYNQVNNMKIFARRRPSPIKQHIKNVFDLPAYYPLTIENEDPGKGFVKINRLTIKDAEWTGDYFEEVPVKVVAIPARGYTFSHWSRGSISTNAELEVNITEPLTLIPHFEESPLPASKIVINEINYSSSDDFDTGDWVELYNPNQDPVSLANWTFKDSNDEHSFVLPEETFIAGEAYLILCRDLDKFRSFHPNLENVIGSFDFGLSSKEDILRLYDQYDVLIDSVPYLSESPWPEGAVGTGATIELRQASLDNSLPESWDILHPFGSPGEINLLTNDTTNQAGSEIISDLSFFPNPFRDQLQLTFSIHQATSVQALLYDVKGSLVQPIFEGELPRGEYRIERNLSHLSPGMYVLKLLEGGQHIRVMKWVKM